MNIKIYSNNFRLHIDNNKICYAILNLDFVPRISSFIIKFYSETREEQNLQKIHLQNLWVSFLYKFFVYLFE